MPIPVDVERVGYGHPLFGNRPAFAPTLPPMEAALTEHAADIVDLVLERHRKYGRSNLADSPGGPFVGLAVRLHDKVARLANNTQDFEDETLADTFRDIVGYGLIGLLFLNGQWPDA